MDHSRRGRTARKEHSLLLGHLDSLVRCFSSLWGHKPSSEPGRGGLCPCPSRQQTLFAMCDAYILESSPTSPSFPPPHSKKGAATETELLRSPQGTVTTVKPAAAGLVENPHHCPLESCWNIHWVELKLIFLEADTWLKCTVKLVLTIPWAKGEVATR